MSLGALVALGGSDDACSPICSLSCCAASAMGSGVLMRRYDAPPRS